jgi:predicted tellurium resistance membrane protein TerC
LLAVGPISSFVERHPTVKMLALAFLILIGTTLIAEGLDQHIPKGYIYFAMGFSVFVEALNLRAGRGRSPSDTQHAAPAPGPGEVATVDRSTPS